MSDRKLKNSEVSLTTRISDARNKLKESQSQNKILYKSPSNTLLLIDGKRISIPTQLLVEAISKKVETNTINLIEADNNIIKLNEHFNKEITSLQTMIARLQNDMQILANAIAQIRNDLL